MGQIKERAMIIDKAMQRAEKRNEVDGHSPVW